MVGKNKLGGDKNSRVDINQMQKNKNMPDKTADVIDNAMCFLGMK